MPSRAAIPLVLGDVRMIMDPVRILAFDEFEALYDFSYEQRNGGLTRENFDACIRVPTRVAVRARRLRVEPLTDKERALIRPELPLRLCRHRQLNWAQLEAESPAALADKLSGWGFELTSQPSLATPAVTLSLFARDFPTRSEKVEATARGRIPALELLWRAGRLFPRGEVIADGGIGIYRAGNESGLPSYFISGYYTAAMWDHEEGRPFPEMPRWRVRRKVAAGNYQQRLNATKKQFPFKKWREAGVDGHDQYTRENCATMAAIFDQLINRLIAVGEKASPAKKLAAFKQAIEATNKLYAKDPSLIESGERDQLGELCNDIARAAGLDPAKYGGGEGPASEWRDW